MDGYLLNTPTNVIGGHSYRTEQTYKDWIKRFILFHGKRHPNELGVEELRAFIAHLATDRSVATPTVLLIRVRTQI